MTEQAEKVVFSWLPMPFGGMQVIQQPFMDSFFGFLSYDSTRRNLFGGYTFATSGYIPAGRNVLVRTFLDRTDSPWLLMLDWDISYKPEDVYALVDAAGPNKIVCGNYVTYFGEGSLLRPCWFEDREDLEYVPCDDFKTDEIRPLTACGMGFTLMHRDALLKMERADNDDPWSWFGHDQIGAERTGEDLSFCRRARACGVEIYGHGGVLLGHTKARMFVPQDIANNLYAANEYRNGKRVLNVGGGTKAIQLPVDFDGWEHVLLDIKPGPDVDVVMDARELGNRGNHYATTQYNWSKVEEASYDAVYCSHNIEHYEVHDVGKVLAGMYRVLKPGGFVQIQCPNFEEVFARLEKGADLDEVAYVSPSSPIRYRDVLFGFEKQIEESGEPFYMHKTAITPAFLMQELKAAGFDEVRIITDGLEMAAVAKKGEGRGGE